MGDPPIDGCSAENIYDSTVIGAIAGGNAAIHADILQQGLTALRAYLAALDVTEPAWPASVHKIKGLAASLGAQRLADAAGRAERCTDCTKRLAWLGLLRREFAHLEARLRH